VGWAGEASRIGPDGPQFAAIAAYQLPEISFPRLVGAAPSESPIRTFPSFRTPCRHNVLEPNKVQRSIDTDVGEAEGQGAFRAPDLTGSVPHTARFSGYVRVPPNASF
jgi:hypothetical protein